ncbi:hypothetical protein LEP1GSC061_0036 [Leptospira wolffii serovar Khorat str. Khorat-H2]|nr:hypothetical protein LEP1GSC061_0036 [Leptospira wolffii serovar Khorat str. Khorat-H2]
MLRAWGDRFPRLLKESYSHLSSRIDFITDDRKISKGFLI